MITYNYFGKEQKIYYEKLPNGLELFLLPNHYVDNYHIEIVTRYGSEIKEFIPIDEKKFFTIPAGTAHFLEHKVFDMDDSDVFEFFSKDGIYVNAGTNYTYTKYYIEGKRKIKKYFNYLLDVIFTPHFDEERVNKEKKIIKEEIKMYDDEPEFLLGEEVKKCLFKKIYQNKIAGTVQNVDEINSEILNKCYNTFYQPSNMFIIASGNIKRKDLLDVINNNEAIKSRKTNMPIIIKKEKEDVLVNEEYKEIYAYIKYSKASYSFKIDLSKLGDDYYMLGVYLSILISFLFGDGSLFDEKIFLKNMATSCFFDYERNDNIYTISFIYESEYADLVKDEIDNTLKNIIIGEDDFERIKKVWEALIIRSIDNIEYTSINMLNIIINDIKYYDKKEVLDNLQYDKLLEIIKKLDFSNKSFVLMLPKI